MELVEARVFAQLDGDGPPNANVWYLDTGATDHMSSSRAAFSEHDETVAGMVRFCDGSVVQIEGKGTMMFACRTGDHRRLHGVYFIPRLDINLISVGQMDEDGYEIHI